jgi:hypothetical protein
MAPLRSIACALPAVLALEPARTGDGQDLAALVPDPPALWIELPDMDRATEKLAGTSLGKLWSALSADIDPSEIAMHFELPEAVLEHGATDGVRGSCTGAALGPGLSEERAERWSESLGGGADLARWERPQGSPPLAGLAFAASLAQGRVVGLGRRGVLTRWRRSPGRGAGASSCSSSRAAKRRRAPCGAGKRAANCPPVTSSCGPD